MLGRLTIPRVLLLAVVIQACADITPLPGYRMEIISAGIPGNHFGAAINNSGQITWVRQAQVPGPNLTEIMRYDQGTITRLTDNQISDLWPKINDRGEVVWESPTGVNGEWEIWIWRDGAARRLVEVWPPGTAPNKDNRGPAINNLGHVVWYRMGEEQCDIVDGEIWLYDEDGPRQLTDAGLSNQSPDINDFDEVVWTRYNFCSNPWSSEILLLTNGVARVISTPDQLNPQLPAINNLGQAVWHYYDPTVGPELVSVAFYHDGVASRLMTRGTGARLNDNSWIALSMYDETATSVQLWLILPDATLQLTDEPPNNAAQDINNYGEIAWVHGRLPSFPFELRVFSRYGSGDMDCDGQISIADIAPFVLALVNPDGYAAQFPQCDVMLADFNGDNAVAVADIGQMIQILINR